ncbi:GlxA family transcriptional regulator [Acidovorax sp.]|uniref:GlxA family transcriptional regulator n=1 Tax=Acidovorax sp. TaxID=1872122 RepID=UPI002ACDFF5A|nr:helix-turn-helix domain-containing protein [Acidovorax sp.]MDZ7862252.1 helix-turn-helix domain-containing protein [Acidovorax sp.]
MNTSLVAPKPFRIGILVYEGCVASEVFALLDVLRIAGHIQKQRRSVSAAAVVPEVHVLGLAGPLVRVASGVPLGVERPRGAWDLLVVPGPDISRLDDWAAVLAPLGPEVAFIRKAFAKGTALAGVCVGSFVLAQAGVLDGRRATTAWVCTAQLAQQFPAVQVQADAVLVEDGAVVTTGAVTSAFDLALHLVKRLWGAGVASATGNVALLPQVRASQAPYVDATLVDRTLPPFSQGVAQWLQTRLAEPFKLATLAQAFYVSPRTLLRRVKEQAGCTPLTLLQRARVEQAKHLLRSSQQSLAQITQAVGYSDVPTFSRLFVQQVGCSPAVFRRG